MFLMNVLFSESPVPSKLVLPAFGSWVVEWGKVCEYPCCCSVWLWFLCFLFHQLASCSACHPTVFGMCTWNKTSPPSLLSYPFHVCGLASSGCPSGEVGAVGGLLGYSPLSEPKGSFCTPAHREASSSFTSCLTLPPPFFLSQ